MRKHKLYTLLFIISTLCYTACKVAKPVTMPDIKDIPSSFTKKDTAINIADISWKDFFSDPYLVALIDTALHNNTDLFITLQRIEILKEQLAMRNGALLPSVNGVISAGGDKYGDYTMNGVGNFDTDLSPNINHKQHIPQPVVPDLFLGFRSSWEIDVWGKLKNQKKAALAELMASEQGRRLAVTTLISEIANLYYDLVALDNELQIVKKNILLQQDGLEVVKVQKEGGRATELAVQQFDAQLLNTEGIQYNILQQITATEDQLNVLEGRYPQSIARDTDIIHQPLPTVLTTGFPSQLVTHRPDIIEAELDLQTAHINVAVARAAFLPSLTLTPYIGLNAFQPSLLFDAGSIAYGALAGLTTPIFGQRQLRGNYIIANAQNKEAIYYYQQVLLNSFSEVVTNINSIKNNTAAFDLKDKEVNELTNAVATSKDLYLSGYANYLEVILAQKGVLEAELELVNNKKELFNSVINLYRSLGGGVN
jgi:multidrug efflux system outer membrane protein